MFSFIMTVHKQSSDLRQWYKKSHLKKSTTDETTLNVMTDHQK